jgi:hypothetical protein
MFGDYVDNVVSDVVPSIYKEIVKLFISVSYRKKIRVGRSEINFLKIFFSWFWRVFAGRFTVESRHQY